MAVTNIDLNTITKATYNGTNLCEIWWCCKTNATCCRIWPQLPVINFNLNYCPDASTGMSEVAEGRINDGYYGGWYITGHFGEGALGDGVQIKGVCGNYLTSCNALRIDNPSPFMLKITTNVSGDATTCLADIIKKTCEGWKWDYPVRVYTMCINSTSYVQPHSSVFGNLTISNCNSSNSTDSWHTGSILLRINYGNKAWANASGTVTVCYGTGTTPQDFQLVGSKTFTITSPTQNLIM